MTVEIYTDVMLRHVRTWFMFEFKYFPVY